MDYALICISFFVLMLVNWKRDKNFFAPNQLFCGYWFIQILFIVPICGISTWEYDGLFWILCALLFFSVAFIAVRYINNSCYIAAVSFDKTISRPLIYGALVVTGIGILVHLISIIQMNALNISDVLFHWSKVSEHLYAVRAEGGEKSSALSKISLIALYTFPLLAGYYHSEIKHKFITAFGMIFITYIALLLGTKAVIMTSCVLWFSGWLTAYIQKNKTVSWNYSVKFILGSFGLVLVSLLAMFVRIYGSSGCTVPLALEVMHSIFGNYAFAHLLAFDHWLYGFEWTTFTGGQYTFFGIFNTLGLADRAIGIFRDVLYIGSLHTNVYTVFRSLITDFSPIGAFGFMAVIGAVSGLAYKRLISGNESSPLAVTICVMTYAFILWSFVTSIFAYASYICAFILFYLCQKLINWKSRRQNEF